jgi:hypothetical protein
MATAESTLAQFNASGSAPVYACRAWVNFNGSGTVAIRASGNVSSITDNGTGDYTVNFTTAMSDVNYNVIATAICNANVVALIVGIAVTSYTGAPVLMTANGVRMVVLTNSSSVVDVGTISISIFR